MFRLLGFSAIFVAGFCTASAQSSSVTAKSLPTGLAGSPESQAPLHVPRPIQAPALFTVRTEAPEPGVQTPRTSRPQVQMTQNDSSCYTLRTYGFTKNDLESSAPRPSSASTCTSGTGVKFKDAGVSASK